MEITPTGTATPAAIAVVLDLDDAGFDGICVVVLLELDEDVVVV